MIHALSREQGPPSYSRDGPPLAEITGSAVRGMTGRFDDTQPRLGTADAIDATVVLLAAPGDRILTSDPDDLTRLAEAAGNRAVIVAC